MHNLETNEAIGGKSIRFSKQHDKKMAEIARSIPKEILTTNNPQLLAMISGILLGASAAIYASKS